MVIVKMLETNGSLSVSGLEQDIHELSAVYVPAKTESHYEDVYTQLTTLHGPWG